ncbi:dihydrofolate reductase family protein [Microlunatus soli]|uniref:RibD C-terminal domain-containing protein n=1 Tax=Microlunatus soli TaxID=630515 RepID=A0A1H2ACK3_9ACTN|nr:dihydrofolate reductase family protein [Microlunatus soli]SDT43589.1 RibD C-terminal domain-containing protein [Microlunatus soli]
MAKRRLVVSVLTSIDGYYEGPDKDLSQMPFEDAFNSHNLELLRRAGTLVYGSRWFEDNWNTWSAVAADESQGDREHEIAGLVLAMDTLIISDSMAIDADDPWASTARVVSRAAAAAEISKLKACEGGDMLVFGSATTWNPLLEAGLVDELIVLIGPALMGEGSKLYQGPRAALQLSGARTLTGSQLVELTYNANTGG